MIALWRAAHAGPAFAVVLLSGLLASAFDLPAARIALVMAAVLAGQLSVGWCNDLVDEGRDRQVGRADKPLVSGGVSTRNVRLACGGAVLAVVPLSLACGLSAGLVHVGCVASAWGYNLRLKSTAWSWLPYAASFGGLVVFVSLARQPPMLPPLWLPVAGALLGVGAHLVNVLPDLEDDAATGVHGLPHRIGARWTPRLAALVLVSASIVLVLGAATSAALAAVALSLVAVLAGLTLLGGGRIPFLAAIGIALVDVVLLVTAR